MSARRGEADLLFVSVWLLTMGCVFFGAWLYGHDSGHDSACRLECVARGHDAGLFRDERCRCSDEAPATTVSAAPTPQEAP